ncbi:hypothetical protein PYCC9005_003459 [Savitreella phatthalungensis]
MAAFPATVIATPVSTPSKRFSTTPSPSSSPLPRKRLFTHSPTPSPSPAAPPAWSCVEVGPTPQRDGKIVGLFDLLSPATYTPKRRPPEVEVVSNNNPQDDIVTPACLRTASITTDGGVRRRLFGDGETKVRETLGGKKVRVRGGCVGRVSGERRSLTTIIRELRELECELEEEEEEDDEDAMEALREVEEKEGEGTKEWKKKGLKRQTRRVKLKPVSVEQARELNNRASQQKESQPTTTGVANGKPSVNYRSLKLRNSGSKGKARVPARFQRRR